MINPTLKFDFRCLSFSSSCAVLAWENRPCMVAIFWLIPELSLFCVSPLQKNIYKRRKWTTRKNGDKGCITLRQYQKMRNFVLPVDIPDYQNQHPLSGKTTETVGNSTIVCPQHIWPAKVFWSVTERETQRDMLREMGRDIGIVRERNKVVFQYKGHFSWLTAVFIIKDPIKQQAAIWNADHSVEINVQKPREQPKP